MRKVCVALLLLCVLTAFVGCKPEAVADVKNPPGANSKISPKPEPKPPNTKPKEEPPVAQDIPKGNCAADRQCQGFLRCIDSQCQTPPAISGKSDSTTPTVTFKTKSGDVKFFTELAISTPEMTRGLMHRRTMKDDWGMIFIYPNEAVRSFWMKNTLIPLDMVHVSATGNVVGVVEGAEPLTLGPRKVGVPARYVFEIKAGYAKKHGIAAGDKMTLKNVDSKFLPQ